MSRLRLAERVLRALAIAIAILGLVDPALTLPWRDRPIVSVVTVQPSPREDPPFAEPLQAPTPVPDAHRAPGAFGAASPRGGSGASSRSTGSSAPTASGASTGSSTSTTSGASSGSTGSSAATGLSTSTGSSTSTASGASSMATGASGSTRSRAFGGTDAGTTSALALRAEVVSSLAREFDVRADFTPDAAAVVLIGDGRSPAARSLTALPDATIVSAVVPASIARGVRIARVDAPRESHISARVPITVQVEAQGLAGRFSTIVARSDGLELARHTNGWHEAFERTEVTLHPLPLRAAPTRFTIDVLDATDADVLATTARTTPSDDGRSTVRRTDTSGRQPDGAQTATRGPAPTGDRRAGPSGAAQPSSPDRGGVAQPSSPDRGSVAQLSSPDRGWAAPGPADGDRLVAMASADVGVDVHDRPLRVLFVNARPSWATQFIRRALDEDARFAVAAATRISRGVTAISAGAPASLATPDLDTFHAIVVGAPELLTRADVDRLRAFARERGGLVVVAPDRRPEGPVLDLLPAREFAERLLADPQALLAPADDSGGAAEPHTAGSRTAGSHTTGSHTAGSDTTGSLRASEIAIPRTLLPGADVLLRLAHDGPAASAAGASRAPASAANNPAPVVITSSLGDGVVLFSGALDAWRFRDRDEAAFDRFWRETIAARAAAAPAPIEVTLDPAVAAPGDPVDVRVRVRSTVGARMATASPPIMSAAPARARIIRATLDTIPSVTSSDAAGTGGIAVRLWPGARPSAYDGAINAPSGDGVYAVLVRLDGETTPGRAVLQVAQGIRHARPAWPGLHAFVDARGGVLVTADHLDELTRHLRASVRPAETRRARHPLRSAWWILPFAAALGGEWFLRRRRGER